MSNNWEVSRMSNHYKEAQATLEQFIRSKPSNQLSYYNLSLLETDPTHNITYDVYNVLSDYIPELKEASEYVILNEKEYYTYLYRPKLLAEYLYGNGELYFIILWLNDMWSVKDFDIRRVRLISKSKLSSILSSVNASEKKFIQSYNQSYSASN